MLRIFIHEHVPVTSFVLEGKLIGPWVQELERCWEDALATNASRTMFVDWLTSVSLMLRGEHCSLGCDKRERGCYQPEF
jgi:hypothetical protein